MNNISQFPSNYKVSEAIYYHLSNEEYCKFKHAGIITKKLHSYRLVLNFREIHIECPVIIRDKCPFVAVLPTFKLPYRPYPCFVYLFAIAFYLTGLSMRKAASKTGRKFGISRFSHSTISRVFSKMSSNISMLHELLHDHIDENINTALPGKPRCSLSTRLTANKKAVAPILFNIFAPILDIQSKESLLVYEHFMKYCCLLI